MKIWIILLGSLIAGCWAVNRLDLDLLEKELSRSPLIDIDTGLRVRSIGSWFKNACKCEGIKCGCCASPKIFGAQLNGCIHFTFVPEQKQLGIEFSALNKAIMNYNFSTLKAENICGHLPGKASFLGYCFRTETTGNENEGIRSCSFFEVKIKSTSAATITFKCVKLLNGSITFVDNQIVGGNSVIKVQAKNPFKKVVDWFNKK